MTATVHDRPMCVKETLDPRTVPFVSVQVNCGLICAIVGCTLLIWDARLLSTCDASLWYGMHRSDM